MSESEQKQEERELLAPVMFLTLGCVCRWMKKMRGEKNMEAMKEKKKQEQKVKKDEHQKE